MALVVVADGLRELQLCSRAASAVTAICYTAAVSELTAGPGQRPEDAADVLQGQGVPEAPAPQSDAVQDRQGLARRPGSVALALGGRLRPAQASDDTTENSPDTVVRPSPSSTRVRRPRGASGGVDAGAEAKTTKKVVLRLECTSCKYKHQLALKRCKHFELGGDKKTKGAALGPSSIASTYRSRRSLLSGSLCTRRRRTVKSRIVRGFASLSRPDECTALRTTVIGAIGCHDGRGMRMRESRACRRSGIRCARRGDRTALPRLCAGERRARPARRRRRPGCRAGA